MFKGLAPIGRWAIIGWDICAHGRSMQKGMTEWREVAASFYSNINCAATHSFRLLFVHENGRVVNGPHPRVSPILPSFTMSSLGDAQSKPTIVIIAFLDTKGAENAFAHKVLTKAGCNVEVIDVSIAVSM
jgi:hypothetical protein